MRHVNLHQTALTLILLYYDSRFRVTIPTDAIPTTNPDPNPNPNP